MIQFRGHGSSLTHSPILNDEGKVHTQKEFIAHFPDLDAATASYFLCVCCCHFFFGSSDFQWKWAGIGISLGEWINMIRYWRNLSLLRTVIEYSLFKLYPESIARKDFNPE